MIANTSQREPPLTRSRPLRSVLDLAGTSLEEPVVKFSGILCTSQCQTGSSKLGMVVVIMEITL